MMQRAKRVLRKMGKGQEGYVLPIVLLLLVMGALLVIPTLQYASTSLKAHQVTETKGKELYAADSGVEDAFHWLSNGQEAGAYSWDDVEQVWKRDGYYINESSVNVTVERVQELGTAIYRITSAATSADGSSTVLSTVCTIDIYEGDFDVGNDDTYYGDTYVEGNVTLGQNAGIVGSIGATGNVALAQESSITGDVDVDGNIELGQGVSVEGNVSADGDITMEQGGNITGTVCAGGNITLANEVEIIGDVHVGGDLFFANEGRIEGNIWADGDIDITFENKGQIVGVIYATGNITITFGHPQAEIDGSVYATGDIYTEDSDQITGTINPDYTGAPPFPEPVCVSIGTPAILAWEIV